MIVVDTHALIWWVRGDSSELSSTAQAVLDHANVVGIAAISCWEIALLAERKRIAVRGDLAAWLETVVEPADVSILPITISIAVRAAQFRQTLRDPADCLITATAALHQAPLVTKDQRIRDSGLVETIW